VPLLVMHEGKQQANAVLVTNHEETAAERTCVAPRFSMALSLLSAPSARDKHCMLDIRAYR
jgi:hypothetical protein